MSVVPVSSPSVDIGPSDVGFPPRNEPLLFREALEAQYRDVLRRSPVSTFVDNEGTIVWTQEYLRYRVNLCSHDQAVFRVFLQIDGAGIQPTCGSTDSAAFPPRNEPFDFMLQLERKYRDDLRRPVGPTYVDVEGNIIWTQEYLRYRVTGCGHTDAQQKVFSQIAGGGIAPPCVTPPSPAGTAVALCFDSDVAAVCPNVRGGGAAIQFYLDGFNFASVNADVPRNFTGDFGRTCQVIYTTRMMAGSTHSLKMAPVRQCAVNTGYFLGKRQEGMPPGGSTQLDTGILSADKTVSFTVQ
jgi:hypothetical protein